LPRGKPDVASHCLASEYEATDGHASRNVEQRRIAALMGAEVVPGKRDSSDTAVVVHGQVRQPLISRGQDAIPDEIRLQHPITALARDVVDAVLRQMQLARKKPAPTLVARDAGQDHRAMFVMIAGK